MSIITAIWGTGLRKTITSIAATIAAIASAIVGVNTATPVLAEWQPVALKTYVDHKILEITNPMLQTESKLLVAQAQQQQTLNQILLTQLQSSLYAAQKDMAAAPSQTVQERIDALQKQIADLKTNSSGGR